MTELEALAATMVNVGYDRDAIDKALRDSYPDQADKVPALLDRAYTDLGAFSRSLEEAIAVDDRAAVAAEHDLGQTMHE